MKDLKTIDIIRKAFDAAWSKGVTDEEIISTWCDSDQPTKKKINDIIELSIDIDDDPNNKRLKPIEILVDNNRLSRQYLVFHLKHGITIIFVTGQPDAIYYLKSDEEALLEYYTDDEFDRLKMEELLGRLSSVVVLYNDKMETEITVTTSGLSYDELQAKYTEIWEGYVFGKVL